MWQRVEGGRGEAGDSGRILGSAEVAGLFFNEIGAAVVEISVAVGQEKQSRFAGGFANWQNQYSRNMLSGSLGKLSQRVSKRLKHIRSAGDRGYFDPLKYLRCALQ